MSIEHHFDTVRLALLAAGDRIAANYDDALVCKQAMDTLARDFARALGWIAEACGGDRREFRGAEDGMLDCISEAMFKAIEDQDAAREARCDPTERDYASGDAARAGAM